MDATTEQLMHRLISKHSLDALRIIVRLVLVGLSKGRVCADDIEDELIDGLDQPNVVGATFHALKRFGFSKTDEVVYRERGSRHGGVAFWWRLDDRGAAERMLDPLVRYVDVALCARSDEDDNQLTLWG